MLLRLDRPREAEECFRRVLVAVPGDAEAALNLGHALARQRRWEHALDAFERALSHRSGWVAAQNGKGGALRRMGRHPEALAVYRRALAVAPKNAGLHNNLGNVLNEFGRHCEAKQAFERAIDLDSRLPEAHLNLGRLRREEGDLAGARSACRRALALDPNLAGARPALASMLQGYLTPRFDPALASELLRLMRSLDVESQDLALAAASQVRARHRLPPRRDGEEGGAALPVVALARDELLRELLARTLNVDPDLEAILVALRRTLLYEAWPEGEEGPGAETERLCAALALQCFANEFLFESSEAEEARVEVLARAFAPPSAAAALGTRERRDLLRLAMYRPLWQVEAAHGLGHAEESALGGELARVVERTLVEPLRERRLAACIPSAGPVRDPVSRRVQAQYETGPYPRWLQVAATDRSPVLESLMRRFSHWKPARVFATGSRALVLGCGSGYEPIELALREPGFRIVAVDLSLASLAYATRMAGRQGVENVHFLHGDLLDLPEVDGSFDLVSASRVLHHMRDPLAGWKAAASRLAEGGLMRVGLYSATARRSIARAREIIRRRGIAATPEGLRAFRLSLLRGELGPEFAELTRSPDLYSESGLRDLTLSRRRAPLRPRGRRLGAVPPGPSLRRIRAPTARHRIRLCPHVSGRPLADVARELDRFRDGASRDLQRDVPVLVRAAGTLGRVADAPVPLRFPSDALEDRIRSNQDIVGQRVARPLPGPRSSIPGTWSAAMSPDPVFSGVDSIVEAVLELVSERVPTAQKAAAESFARPYFAGTAVEDLQDRSIVDLYGAALSHFNFAHQRRPGKPKVRVYNPVQPQHGWRSTHTIVEVVSDDMPFLVDSVRMALNRRSLTTHLVIHPVMRAHRDASGVLTGPNGEEAITEAVIHVEVDRQTEERVLDDIAADIRSVLEDVRGAVEDWQPMHERLRGVLTELESNPPPLDESELARGRAFLEWVSENHFTFLGYREYELLGGEGEERLRSVGGSGFGLLRESEPRESTAFASLSPQIRRLAREPRLLLITKANARSTVHRPGYLDYIGIKTFDSQGRVTGERRFLGLYTSAAYNQVPRAIPLLREKVARVMERATYPSNSHAAKALLHILETFPRDLLFQVSDDELYETGIGNPAPAGAPAHPPLRAPRPHRAFRFLHRLRAEGTLQYPGEAQDPEPARGSARRTRCGIHRASLGVGARAPLLRVPGAAGARGVGRSGRVGSALERLHPRLARRSLRGVARPLRGGAGSGALPPIRRGVLGRLPGELQRPRGRARH